METKANYVLIGAFTLACIFGALGLLIWLAKVEVDRQYSYYDILFEDVAGLSAAGDVRYNGLPVGQVVDLNIDETDPAKVRVRIEVGADTPVNTRTVAKLQSQGVTGVSYVGLSGGGSDAEPLPEGSEIPSERSALQSVFEGAPVLLDRGVELLENVNDVFNEENRQAVGTILTNLSTASGRLDGVLSDFETLSADLGLAAREVAAFSERLDSLAETAETTLTTATGTLQRADSAIETIEGFTQDQLVPLAEDIRQTSQTATRVIDDIGSEAARIAEGIDTVTQTGRETLETATTTLQTANEAFAAANVTIAGIETFRTEQLTPLTEDLRATSQTANSVIAQVGTDVAEVSEQIAAAAQSGQTALDTATQAFDRAQQSLAGIDTAVAGLDQFRSEELVPLARDIRETAQTTNRVVAELGDTGTQLAGQIGQFADDGRVALSVANNTFQNADQTLVAIDAAMASATATLDTAGQTFAAANRIIENDIGGIITDVRAAATAFTSSVDKVAANIDQVADEVLAASQSASNFLGTLEDIVVDNRRQVSEFLRIGLPEFVRFIEDGRGLVANMERLVNRIERDPARFLLGTQNSEFRR